MVFAGDEEDIPSVEAARAAEAAQEKQLEAEAKGAKYLAKHPKMNKVWKGGRGVRGAKYLAKHPKKNKVCLFVWGGG